MAASALMRPSIEFKVATSGWSSPVGQMVRYPNWPDGTTDTLSEYAAALVGMLHRPSGGMGKLSEVPPGIGPPVRRVSISRQGVTATNCSGAALAPRITDTVLSPWLGT